MSPHERGGNHEAFDGTAWLSDLRTENPDMLFIDEMSEIAEIVNDELEQRYGPQSVTPLAYHNASHSFDAARRGIQLLRVHSEIAPDLFEMSRAPSLIVATLLLHDIYQLEGSGENERLSADFAARLLSRYGFREDEVYLNKDMIMATVTEIDSGRLRQPMLAHTVSHNPLCLIAATADINAIAMEGLPRLIRDSISLAAEHEHVSPARAIVEDPKAIAAMLGSQLAFFGSGLDAVAADLRLYYDESTALEIQKRYKKDFGSLGSEAIRAASILSKVPIQISEVIKSDASCKPEDAARLLVGYVRNLVKN